MFFVLVILCIALVFAEWFVTKNTEYKFPWMKKNYISIAFLFLMVNVLVSGTTIVSEKKRAEVQYSQVKDRCDYLESQNYYLESLNVKLRDSIDVLNEKLSKKEQSGSDLAAALLLGGLLGL